jgi:hypothetical protein
VKVVSSMGTLHSVFQTIADPVIIGEQSVGKSFALNHLVDTSFAGSAMRTTEGVWMSVNPAADSLIVALDFEGLVVWLSKTFTSIFIKHCLKVFIVLSDPLKKILF